MDVLQYLFDLENTNQELKSDLKDLYINSAVYVMFSLLGFIVFVFFIIGGFY